VLVIKTWPVVDSRSRSGWSADRRTGESEDRRMQRAFAAHLRHAGRVYPAAGFRRVMLIIDTRTTPHNGTSRRVECSLKSLFWKLR
jgi:hypothetical protein